MGSSKYVSLTPYLKVNGIKEETRIVFKRYCPNHPQSDQSHNKFCSECGTEILSMDVPKIDKLTPMDVLFKHPEYKYIEDRLWNPEYLDVILPNHAPPNNIKIEDDNEHAVINLLDKLPIMVSQVAWFKEYYAKEIQILTEEFGESNVNVCWGLIVYWS